MTGTRSCLQQSDASLERDLALPNPQKTRVKRGAHPDCKTIRVIFPTCFNATFSQGRIQDHCGIELLQALQEGQGKTRQIVLHGKKDLPS